MTDDDRIKLEPSWKEALRAEFDQPYMHDLREFLRQEKAAGKEIYPPGPLIFNALNSTPLEQVKVVILGQDPYHGPNQAHGLAFSVLPGVAIPPSLLNMYKELEQDIPGFQRPQHGFLESWAKQGVLLLNTVLTVEAGKAHSHARFGWETFTDNVISAINTHREGVIFLLWGSHAQKKGSIIDAQRNHVLKAPHPSPLSAHRGFFGCQHFSKANALLSQAGQTPIDWTPVLP